jgi:UDP-3-O-[3-hydroxymyristoyl] glucosamine N-acyltransferase
MMNKSVGEIAELVGGTVVGDGTARITGLNGIKQAKAGDLTFAGSRQYLPYVDTTGASAILVNPEVVSSSRTLIHVKDPYPAFVKVIHACAADAGARHPTGIHPSVVLGRNVLLGREVGIDAHVRIADDAAIGDGVVLYANVYIGRGSRIGAHTIVYPNVTIRDGVTVGARCIIHSGTVLGSDGFGFAPVEGAWFKIPQLGNLIVGDDVEIGANSAVDRATFGSTVIGRGTKIDNLVQIGHNVEIGEHCVISGMSGVAGSATMGNHVTVAAQVGIGDHVEIGDGVTIGARSGVTQSISPGRVVSGFPAMDHQLALRVLAGLRHLPQIPCRIRELERRIQHMEEHLHGTAENHS